MTEQMSRLVIVCLRIIAGVSTRACFPESLRKLAGSTQNVKLLPRSLICFAGCCWACTCAAGPCTRGVAFIMWCCIHAVLHSFTHASKVPKQAPNPLPLASAASPHARRAPWWCCCAPSGSCPRAHGSRDFGQAGAQTAHLPNAQDRHTTRLDSRGVQMSALRRP